MDISITAPAVQAPPRPAERDVTSALTQLQGLASVVLDTDGRYSDGDKLDAYNASFQASVTGQYAGLGQDGANLLNQMANSGVAQQVETQRAHYADAMMGAIQRAGASGAPRSQALGAAALSHFDNLSSSDKMALFSSLNAPNRAGVTPFASLDDWRGQMATMGKVPRTPVDRVELSDAAIAMIGASAPAQATAPPPTATAYVTGSLANVRV